MSYGKRLSALRKEKKQSQEQLSKIVGINRSTYARYETGNTQPDYDTLKRLADHFEVTTDYLLGRSDTPHKTEEEEFQAFINDPELEVWYKELPKNKESELRRLKKMWDLMKNDDDQ